MNCRFEKEWLKYGLNERNNIETLHKKGYITEKVKNALLAIHDHDCHPEDLPTEPSAKDLELVYEEYG